jgi:hypothetical protein
MTNKPVIVLVTKSKVVEFEGRVVDLSFSLAQLFVELFFTLYLFCNKTTAVFR